VTEDYERQGYPSYEREKFIMQSPLIETQAELCFLMVLNQYCDWLGENAIPKSKRIAKEARMTVRTVERVAKGLEAKGVIKIEKRYREGTSVPTTNRYKILLGTLQKSVGYPDRGSGRVPTEDRVLPDRGSGQDPDLDLDPEYLDQDLENPPTPLPAKNNRNDAKKAPPVATLAATLPPQGGCVQGAKVILEFESIQVPDHLQTPEFLEAWQERIKWAAARPKSSRPVLSSQIKELTPYSATEATMLVRRAMSWQGLGLDSYQRRKESNIPGVTTNSNFDDVIARHRFSDAIRVARYENLYGRQARERGEDDRAPKGWLADNLEANTFG
jgi:hypothetical protein